MLSYFISVAGRRAAGRPTPELLLADAFFSSCDCHSPACAPISTAIHAALEKLFCDGLQRLELPGLSFLLTEDNFFSSPSKQHLPFLGKFTFRYVDLSIPKFVHIRDDFVALHRHKNKTGNDFPVGRLRNIMSKTEQDQG